MVLDPLLSLLGQISQDLGLENDLPLERDLEDDRVFRPFRSSSSGGGDGNLNSFAAVARDSIDGFALRAV